MSYHARRILPPGASRKRKERETPSYSTWPSSPVTAVSSPSQKGATTSSKQSEPVSSNRLLAGYMAYEFLTNGTLFGQKFDPARAEAVPVNNISSELKRGSKPGQGPIQEPEPKPKQKPRSQAYIEVASLLKNDGAHIPGVVNPMQLARWIQM